MTISVVTRKPDYMATEKKKKNLDYGSGKSIIK
jgi:hypothetical protein